MGLDSEWMTVFNQGYPNGSEHHTPLLHISAFDFWICCIFGLAIFDNNHFGQITTAIHSTNTLLLDHC